MEPSSEPWSEATVRAIAEDLKPLDGPLLPILHAINERLGHVDARAVPVIADVLNLSRAEVPGVLGFYPDFRAAPPGRHVLKLCRAEACQAVGGDALADHAHARLGTRWGETSADGAVTVEPVFCLGLCACAPAALLDGDPVGRLDPARLDALLDDARRRR
jgi:formate dehydrogenase subunit gamma